MHDLRLAARKLKRQPFFSLSVILLSALGVGAGTTVFTVANSLLLEPPPLVAQPDRIVRLNPAPDNNGAASYPDYSYYRDNARTFSDLFAYDAVAHTLQLREADRMEEADGRFVTGNFFRALAVPAVAGRMLTEEDDREQAENVLVVGEAFAERWFGSVPAALGRTLRVSGHSFAVVGVVAGGFHGAARDDAPVELWLPMWKRVLVNGRPRLDMVRTPDYVHAFMTVMGRLRAGVTPTQAQSSLDNAIRRGLCPARRWRSWLL
jgi:hypothetical protein